AAAVTAAAGGRAMLTLPPSVRIWCSTSPTDLRRGFDGLSGLVRSHLHADPLSGHLFVFFNRKADRLKVLYWDRDDRSISSKRLQRGPFPFPTANAASLELPPGQLQMTLDGVDVERVRRYKRYQRPQPA